MITKKKIYISGAGGMLGHALYHEFKNEYDLLCIDKIKNEKWINKFNFNNKNYFKKVVKYSPHYLFHIGALTDLEYCEKNTVEAMETNYKSVKVAVKICNHLKIPLVFISTAGIFDGKKIQYSEFDVPRPISIYAKTKYKAEKYIKKYMKKYLIIRPGWMMGGGERKDKKFVKKIIEQINSNVKELNIVNDKLGTPTYTVDLATNLKFLIKKNKYGLYHMVCNGMTSRLDVSKQILKFFNKDNKIKINEVDSSFFKTSYFAKRPFSERLINKKLNSIKLNKMRHWRIALKHYLNNYNKI